MVNVRLISTHWWGLRTTKIRFPTEFDVARRNLEIKSLNARRIPAQATSEAWNIRASTMDQKNIRSAPNLASE